MRRALFPVFVLCAALLPRAGHAQFRDQLYTSPVVVLPAESTAAAAPSLALVPLRTEDPPSGPAAVAGMVLGGLAGNAAGFFVGLILGLGDTGSSGDEECMDLCLGTWGLVSLMAGTTVGTTLGVHLGNGGRGSLPLSLMTSTVILGTGYALSTRHPDVFVVVPLSQLVGSVVVELFTTPRR